MHRKLRISDFAPLYSSLTLAFNGWVNKVLSYAGRVVLLSTVISGILLFWMSTIKLPMTCIRKIEGMCSRFLWSGNIAKRGLCKVSWKSVCLPKSEGGLGLRRLAMWNSTLSLRHIWSLFSDNNSLWVSWHVRHSIKDSSFWAITPKSTDTYNWKALLKLRPLAERFIRGTVLNGERLRFWFDSWTPLGPLIKHFGETGPSNLQIPRQSKVSFAVMNNEWKLPHPRTDEAVQLHAFLTSINPPSSDQDTDVYDWVVNGVSCKQYCSMRTWEACRPVGSLHQWTSTVWFKGAVPKHSFFMWLSCLNKLPTKSRLFRWGLSTDWFCCLCNKEIECRDHVLLKCDFGISIWKQIFQKIDPNNAVFSNWAELLSWVKNSSQSAPGLLRKLVTLSTLYNIWRERNDMLHNAKHQDINQTFDRIYKEVKNVISSKSSKKSFKKLMSKWI